MPPKRTRCSSVLTNIGPAESVTRSIQRLPSVLIHSRFDSACNCAEYSRSRYFVLPLTCQANVSADPVMDCAAVGATPVVESVDPAAATNCFPHASRKSSMSSASELIFASDDGPTSINDKRYFLSPVQRYAAQNMKSGVESPPGTSSSVLKLMSVRVTHLPSASCLRCANMPSTVSRTSLRVSGAPLNSTRSSAG